MSAQSKKISLLILFLVCIFSFFIGGICIANAEETDASASGDWKVVNAEGDGYWKEENGVLTATGNNVINVNNFFVTEDENAVGNYVVSAHFKMTENPVTATENSQIGIVPWYMDENNYVVFNLWWRQESWCGNNGNVLCNVTMEGKQNGKFIEVFDGVSGNYNNVQFSDLWVWNNTQPSFQQLHKPINAEEGWNVKVIKRVSDPSFSAGVSGDHLEVIVNDVPLGFFTTSLTSDFRPECFLVGVSSRNAQGLTVTDFSVEDEDMSEFGYPYSDYNYNPMAGSEFVATGKNWTCEGEKITGDARENLLNTPVNAIKKVDANFANYSLESEVSITEKGTGNSRAGLAVWYKNHDNFLNADLLFDGTQYKAVISGKIGGVEAEGSEASAVTIAEDKATLRADKIGSTVILYINDAEACRYTASEKLPNAFAGANLINAKASFTSIAISELPYESYEEYTAMLGGRQYILSSKTMVDFTENDGTVSINATDFEKYAYAVTSRDTFSSTTVKVLVSPISFGSAYSFGIIGYYESAESFLFGVLDGTNAALYRHTAEKDIEIAKKAYSYDKQSIELSFFVEDGKVSLLAGEQVLVDAEVIGLNPDMGRFGGFIVQGGSFDFSHPAFEGWRTYEPKTLGDWSVVGPEFGTWMVGGDGNLIGDVSKTKVERNTTFALQDIAFTNEYYVYSIINVTAFHDNWERRAGLIPWYIDENNWVVVYASHISGNEPEIVAEAKIEGKNIPMKWDAFKGVLALLDTEIVLETYVSDDCIQVYNGKSNQAIWSFEVPGLSAASQGKEGQIKAGVSIVDVKAAFKNFDVSDQMMSKNTVPPVIQIIGTPVKTAEKGSTIILPVVDVVDDLGESINCVFTIKAPDGTAVDLNGGARFVAEQEGNYTVTITAADSWGNQAEPYEYTIAVTAAKGGGGKSGCNSMLSEMSLVPAAIVLLAFSAILIFRRKKISK